MSAEKPKCDDYGSHWRLVSTCDHESYQKIDQLSRQYSITNEILLQPAARSQTLALPTDYETLGPDIDLVLADMCPKKYNAMPGDMNGSYLVSNTGAPRAHNVDTSTITIF